MRYFIGIWIVLTLAVTIFMARNTLSILDRAAAADASAVQITQVQTEAQTILLFGILSLLGAIAVGVLLPARDVTESKPKNMTATTEPSPATPPSA